MPETTFSLTPTDSASTAIDPAVFAQLEQTAATAQAQREAIVDLLLLGMQVDRHISLMETDLLEAEIASLGWDEFHAADIYLQRAAPIVRDTIGHDQRQTQLLESIRDRLVDLDVRKDAIERFATMLAIDGTVAIEAQLLDQAMAILAGGN
jgi:hypothetical protein